jgi:hypothetical protein
MADGLMLSIAAKKTRLAMVMVCASRHPQPRAAGAAGQATGAWGVNPQSKSVRRLSGRSDARSWVARRCGRPGA